ncbi:MAG: preprotein translocase subunit YajC [Candidatus Coatesbacteria bacterium]|nr:preprotein translocase subunit YajC [Candidatus Coatesbacteria bacterium]
MAVISLLAFFEAPASAMAPAQGGGEAGSPYSSLLFMGAILVIFYFLLIRPQQRRQKEIKRMQSDLKVGDRITTSGGIHGTVASISENTVSLKVAEKVKLEIDRTAIAVVGQPENDATK